MLSLTRTSLAQCSYDLLPHDEKLKIVDTFDDLNACKDELNKCQTPPGDHSLAVIVGMGGIFLGLLLGHNLK